MQSKFSLLCSTQEADGRATGKTCLGQNRVFCVLGHAPPRAPLYFRPGGGQVVGQGRSDSNISILLQRELRCEKFSDLLWSQQMASSTRTRGKKSPFDARPVFLLEISVCLHRGLQLGCCKGATTKKSHNGSARNSGRFVGTTKTDTHYLLGLPSAS